ncbi:MAG: hypothetical protein IJJ06_12790 [Mogibacterium sp.]|nr:hypothetical protein [Mogibacterium sp.]MBQ6440960.1 hypothetical protein [Mogibacterium sp.]
MDRVEFGIDIRRKLTGADLYVRILQICSLLPLPYIFLARSHPPVLGTRNLLSALFDTGICVLPRIEAYALSFLYRQTLSEVAVYFVILAIALALGIVASRLLRGNPEASVRFHKAIAVLIVLDLVIRIIPVRANIAFGIPAALTGLVIRAACLYLVIRDLKACDLNTAK